MLTVTTGTDLHPWPMIVVVDSFEAGCIVDNSLPILVVSEQVATDLTLIYNTTITVNLKDSDPLSNQLLGLAKNVLCHFGPLKFLFHMHVFHSPHYDVILGHPFKTIINSAVKNFGNCPPVPPVIPLCAVD